MCLELRNEDLNLCVYMCNMWCSNENVRTKLQKFLFLVSYSFHVARESILVKINRPGIILVIVCRLNHIDTLAKTKKIWQKSKI